LRHKTDKISIFVHGIPANLKARSHWGVIRMLRTIQIGSCMSVQGLLVRQLDDGRIVIRVDDRLYQGVPVTKAN